MSSLMQITASLIAVFHKYSEKEGDKNTLTKAELKTLLQTELGDFLSTSNDPEKHNKIFKDLDIDADGVVDFQEFMSFYALLTMCCHESFKDYQIRKK